MPTTDTSEKGLESLIVASLADAADYEQGNPEDYDRDHAVDLAKLFAFLRATQPRTFDQLDLEQDGPKRQQFLARLQGEIAKRGVVDVLRKGIKHGPATIELFYGTPTPGNALAAERFDANIFSVTRQLHYSKDATKLSLDLAVFINGLPIATFELKNNLTKQTIEDAVQQYQRDRDPRELLFQFGRCAVHFAVDDQEVRFCAELKGKASWFLPFNRGWNDGAGNPPNPDGLKTDYLWKTILAKASLTNIIENYAQVVDETDNKGKKRQRQIFPRYHQLDVVRALLADAGAHGAGKRYLIQHSAGSGKSNSIAWLAHQLVELKREERPVFDSVIVVTDRKVLDKQIRDTIKQFAQVAAIVGAAQRSGDLRTFIQSGKKIIITTIQKFPLILDEIGDEHRGRRFAILIDEAHSSQGGRIAATMNTALADQGAAEEDETTEDVINRLMASRKMLPNASYFAFTATPKNRTLEIFGTPIPEGGKVQHHPFHSYTMKQAIQEGFILDVLKNYTPVSSYYRLTKAVPDDPEFDMQRATKKLRRYVEGHEHAVRQKAEIMVDHFHEQVLAHGKIGGQAQAMIVTGGIARAIQYYHAVQEYLLVRRSPYKAVVAFSGEHEYGGAKVTEATLNGFPSNAIPDEFRKDPYRFLIVADKFQTGYDEPLLHTMYVDKALSDVKAVQTLSRLNRAHPQKHDTFVLDFANTSDTIAAAFAPYYRTTILSEETDPNKLHDLKADLDRHQVYTPEQVDELAARYLDGADRERLDPLLDACVGTYLSDLDEDGQIDFKSKAKVFVRTYNFLAAVLPYTNADWEKLALFLGLLVSKLPAPKEEDLSRGILETIDIDSYRVEVKAALKIALPDDDGAVGPVPTSAGGRKGEAELERLSNILRTFNEQFGNIEWKDGDKINKVIAEELPAKVAANKRYQNAIKQDDRQNARIEHDKALEQAVVDLVFDHSELYKHFTENPSFKKMLGDIIFAETYQKSKEEEYKMASEEIQLRHTWRLGNEMAKGGFGHIHEAEGEDGAQVVVKLVPKEPGAARELLFEDISSQLNIMPILDTGEWNNYYVLVMPRAEKSLRQHLIDSGGKLTLEGAVPILIDVAEALASLHQGVVHRDLKPENVLFYQGRWCLADFGIARYAEATTAPDTHKFSMSHPYAAPEQWREERATPATDVYALGVMAFELLQGRRPFPGPFAPDYREQHLRQPPPTLDDCAPPIVSLVAECLHKTPETRPTPNNILARLRRSQQTPSPALAALQAANQQIVHGQSLADAQASAQKTVAERRAELFSVAGQTLEGITGQLIARILEAAPSAKVTQKPSIAVQLGSGVLIIGRIMQAPLNCLAVSGDRAPFDVIAYTSITARKPRDRYDYEGRSHSLWFCDAHNAGVYRWFETAFMVMPGIPEGSTIDPFAFAPTDKDAGIAFAQVMSHRQVAWEPFPFDQGDEDQFIERWIGWFAEASTGRLSHPFSMPENSGGHFRRGGS